MDLVLFHTGAQFPEYVEYCLKQFRFFNPDNNVYFLTENKNIKKNKQIFDKYNVSTCDLSTIKNKKIKYVKKFFRKKTLKNILKIILGREEGLWYYSLIRFFYIEEFVRKNNIENFIHIENDILIYENLDNLETVLKPKYKNIGITVGSKNKVMTGFSYFKNYKSVEMMNNFIVDKLNNEGVEFIKSKYNVDILSEMVFLKYYADEKGSEYMDFLPILPNGKYSNSFNEFNSLFDPASYGQYVGGTFDGQGEGFLDKEHFIGREFISNGYKVLWKEIDSLKVPYLLCNEKEIKINNLHIHSKKLNKFLSR